MIDQPEPASPAPAKATAIDKALDVCEALSGAPRGLSLRELSRALKLPAPTTHRLLAILRRRGFVRQDEETGRYTLTLRILDLSFRLLGRSEIRLHAYPVAREHVLRTGSRVFVAVPSAGEVTYAWQTGPDEVGMHTAYGREMPGHCALYFEQRQATRRLSCLRQCGERTSTANTADIVRFGAPPHAGAPRLNCTCAPVFDYTGREVARIGVFAHGDDEGRLAEEERKGARELARLVSLRLGCLPGSPMASTA